MDGLTTELIQVLSYLLPGFLAAWIFYGLTSYPKPELHERIIQALIFTIIIQGLTYITSGRIESCSNEIKFLKQDLLVISLFISAGLGLFLSWMANTDYLHAALRLMRITSNTSYHSEWFSAFHNHERWIVVHLNDSRRVMGWPREWPSSSDEGHFALESASWLLDDNTEIKMIASKIFLLDVTDVQFVEFLKDEGDDANES